MENTMDENVADNIAEATKDAFSAPAYRNWAAVAAMLLLILTPVYELRDSLLGEIEDLQREIATIDALTTP